MLLSKRYGLVQVSKRDVAKGKPVLNAEIRIYRRADFTAVGLDECCFSSILVSSLHLPTPSLLPHVESTNLNGAGMCQFS